MAELETTTINELEEKNTLETTDALIIETNSNINKKVHLTSAQLAAINSGVSSENAIKKNTIARLQSLELSFETPFIDFHFDNSQEDFTSRIIESSRGCLEAQALFNPETVEDADLAKKGVTRINTSEGGLHSPLISWGTLLTFGQGDYFQQIIFPWFFADNGIFYRVKNSDGWKPWKQIASLA